MSTENCPITSDTSLLVSPKPKQNSNFPERYPFPIFRESASEQNVAWNCIIGHLKDQCVEITDSKNMELLFTMGFFGKGTLSRSTPQVVEERLSQQANSKKRKKPKQKNEESASKSQENPSKRIKTEDEIEVVLSDTNESSSDDESSSSDSITVTTSKNDVKEALQLTFEEAFFLSYGLGVLVVKDRDQPLDLMRLWHKLCELHPAENFPAMYTAYHHFRSKGWVVRSGTKYGTDFALYKHGPPFYHSSYAVIVKPVKEQNLREITMGGRPHMTWSSLAGLNRICTHVAKAVLMLYVIKPSSISENKISTPFCISQYKLEEVLVHRWVPSVDREED